MAYSTSFCPYGPGCCGKVPTTEECDPDGYCPDMYWADFPFNACDPILNPNISSLCSDCEKQSSLSGTSGTCTSGSCNQGSMDGAVLSGLIGIKGVAATSSTTLKTLANGGSTPTMGSQLIPMGGKIVFFLPQGKMADIAPAGSQETPGPVAGTTQAILATSTPSVRSYRPLV